MSVGALLACPTHPRYQAKRKPSTDCPECAALYRLVESGYTVAAPVHSGGLGRLMVRRVD